MRLVRSSIAIASLVACQAWVSAAHAEERAPTQPITAAPTEASTSLSLTPEQAERLGESDAQLDESQQADDKTDEASSPQSIVAEERNPEADQDAELEPGESTAEGSSALLAGGLEGAPLRVDLDASALDRRGFEDGNVERPHDNFDRLSWRRNRVTIDPRCRWYPRACAHRW